MNMTYREAISQALRQAITRDERIFLMGEDIGRYGGSYAVTKGLLADFGEERIMDTPISEAGVVGVAIGAAMGGLRPVVELMTINFALLAMDQIVNHAAKLLCMSGGQITIPLVVRTVGGAGRQLAATHSQSFEGWFAHVPGIKVATPASPYDAKGLLRAALDDPNPVIFIEHSLLYGLAGDVPEEEYSVPLGKADVKRTGTDVTIVAYSRMVQVALEAAALLEKEGVNAEVMDLRSLRPWDKETVLASVKKTTRAVIAEEGWRTGGFGAEVASTIASEGFDYLDAPVQRVAGVEAPMPYNKALEQAAIPKASDIIAAVRAVL
ncbi:MAG: alpha-ketoacid dehydrogenase subunit beta [Chloroflexi bacterium]|nr:alpha-ketoacid dehydrogenase subunit beta [Chloroflexota bacterium]